MEKFKRFFLYVWEIPGGGWSKLFFADLLAGNDGNDNDVYVEIRCCWRCGLFAWETFVWDVHKRWLCFAWWSESSHTIKRKKWPQNKGERSGGGGDGIGSGGGYYVFWGNYYGRIFEEMTMNVLLFVGDDWLVGEKNLDGWRILCCRFLMLVASRLSRNSNQVRTTRYGIIIHFFSLSFCDFFTLFHI